MRLTIAVVAMAVAPVVLAQASTSGLDRENEWRRDQPFDLEPLHQQGHLAADESARPFFSPELEQSNQLNVSAEPFSGSSQEPDWYPAGAVPAQGSGIEFEYNRSRIDSLNPHNTW